MMVMRLSWQVIKQQFCSYYFASLLHEALAGSGIWWSPEVCVCILCHVLKIHLFPFTTKNDNYCGYTLCVLCAKICQVCR